jgi:hypothetical protein
MVQRPASRSASVAKLLAREIAIGHRMPQHGDALAAALQKLRQIARHRRFAGAGAERAHGDHGQRRGKHGARRPQKREIGAERQRARGEMHHLLVPDIAIGEDDLVDAVAAHRLELRLWEDRDAIGVERARERRRIAPRGDARDLRRGEGEDAH